MSHRFRTILIFVCLLALGPKLWAGRVHCQMNSTSQHETQREKRVVKSGNRTVVKKTVSYGVGGSGQSLLLQPGKRGRIRYNDIHLGVTCQPTNSGIIITLDVQHNDLLASTDLMLSNGQKIEIASVVENLKDEAKALGFPRGFFQKKTSEQKQKNLMLRVVTREL